MGDTRSGLAKMLTKRDRRRHVPINGECHCELCFIFACLKGIFLGPQRLLLRVFDGVQRNSCIGTRFGFWFLNNRFFCQNHSSRLRDEELCSYVLCTVYYGWRYGVMSYGLLWATKQQQRQWVVSAHMHLLGLTGSRDGHGVCRVDFPNDTKKRDANKTQIVRRENMKIWKYTNIRSSGSGWRGAPFRVVRKRPCLVARSNRRVSFWRAWSRSTARTHDEGRGSRSWCLGVKKEFFVRRMRRCRSNDEKTADEEQRWRIGQLSFMNWIF